MIFCQLKSRCSTPYILSPLLLSHRTFPYNGLSFLLQLQRKRVFVIKGLFDGIEGVVVNIPPTALIVVLPLKGAIFSSDKLEGF